MDSNWLEDLVALVESETLTQAAENRNITQPAFTRRIQALEAYLGADVIDRSRRPARPTPAISRHIEDIRALARGLHRLRNDLQVWESEQQRLVIAAQHAISVAHLPDVVSHIRKAMPSMTIRMNSANWDECYAMLMTGQAMVMFGYETDARFVSVNHDMLEKQLFREDRLIPVCSPGTFNPGHERLNIVSYPTDGFLGQIMQNQILPRVSERFRVSVACELALTPAALQLALQGLGVAWLPVGMVQSHMDSGSLQDLSDTLGDYRMDVVMLRVRATRPDFAETAWSHLLNAASI
ncbi:MAG: LysR family transcriptional regulator [Rhodospirillales bacterium]|jgi:LysR family transcriptional regulator, hypochlorite-specific transcription factor HypT|nr:LysR family transcriptional regulator [Rhodospirillales bacterium]MBT4039811.1 LysR family transcriptional regulator [Rhodospirillales bacterium]MBT4627557.1 LysR family transcriptional regulator [Rhodospirillales bacterium]MBT5350571.1 LysR family transcriptional regulator [Rhodospirillales bacterium]MBT5521677.1 LysR family transcriptional regulator [Rhodospirillales bacterium]